MSLTFLLQFLPLLQVLHAFLSKLDAIIAKSIKSVSEVHVISYLEMLLQERQHQRCL